MAGERILIIEDDPENVEFLLTNVLSSEGYLIQTANCGQAGLSAVQETRPDLVLLGLSLQDVSSAVMLQRLQISGNPPVILMAPQGLEAEAVRAFHLGARDAVIKPFTPEKMLLAVARVLHQERLDGERDWLVRKLAAANEELERSLVEEKTLYETGKKVLSSLNLQEVWTVTVQAAVTITHAEESYLLLKDPDSEKLYLRAAQNLNQDPVTSLCVPVNDSTANHVMHSGEPVTLTSEGDASIKMQYRSFFSNNGCLARSTVNVPIQIQGRVIGVLCVNNMVSDRQFTERDIKLISVLADYAAIAIKNAQALDRASRSLCRCTKKTLALQALDKATEEWRNAKQIVRQALEHAVQATGAVEGVVGLQSSSMHTEHPLPVTAQSPDSRSKDSTEQELMWASQDGSPGRPEPYLQSIVRNVIGSCPCHSTQNMILHQPDNPSPSTYLVAPIRHRARALGAIGLKFDSTYSAGLGCNADAMMHEDTHFVSELADRIADHLNQFYLLAEVSAEQRKKNLILQSISEAVCTVNGDLCITSVNRAMESITGWKESELLGRRYDQVLAPEILDSESPSERVLAEGTLHAAPRIISKSTILHKDGHRIPVISTTVLSRDDDTSIAGVIAMTYDVTSTAELRQLHQEFVTTSPNCYPVTLRPIIDQAVRYYQAAASGRLFQINLAKDLPFVMGDEKKVELVLANLIDSALALGDPQQPIVISAATRDDCVVVVVERWDQSTPNEAHDAPYPAPDSIDSQIAFNGNIETGQATPAMGLYTARELIQAQGGQLWIENQPGAGIRFHFSLPKIEVSDDEQAFID